MTAITDRAGLKPVELGVAVVPLLALAVFINYVDRGNLATAAPLIKDQLHLSATQIGLLLSAFFWSYMPGQLMAGWLSERINAYRTLALGLAIWSVATIASGLAGGFMSLIVLRIVLGFGESAAFPCSSKLLAQHLPHDKLGAANGLIGVGLALGPAFGTFAGGLLMARLGWRPVFLLFGLVSLLWLVPWLISTREASAEATRAPAAPAPSFRAILAKREAWGASLGHFCNNYAFYFVISWLPLYLVKARGFSVSHMAEVGGLIYVVYAASSMTVGWATDRWMQAGASANLVRKTTICTGLMLTAGAMMACAMGDARTSVISLFVAGAAFGFGTPNIFAIGQTLAGPVAAGKWVAVQNVFGSLAGIIAPIITGAVVDRTGQFTWAFAIAAAMALLGVVGWGLVIRKVAPVSWAQA
ncbi:MFS transporter [Phenylobacterium aquaticum]|uniref:MFS transporter n=1 Tax=Phenylobacterium aquaticum TaxID=1763816 RepID=UPI0026EDE7E0|nr:MFS transporter [Phenylobacterium aquaticum]